MKKHLLLNFFSLLLVFFLLAITANTSFAETLGCPAVFPSPLQNSDKHGEIKFGRDGQVFGDTDNILETTKLTDKGAGSAPTCDTVFCSASGTLSETISLPAFNTTHNNTRINTGANGTYILVTDGSEYKEIKTGGGSIIRDDGAATTYLIKTLKLKLNDTLILRGGSEYWIEDFKLEDKAQKIIVNGTGTARLYVKNDLKFKEQSEINTSGNADNLFILAYKKFEVGKNSLNANFLAYSIGDVKINSVSNCTGAIA